MRTQTVTLSVLLLLSGWGLAWSVARDRAARALEEERIRTLRRDIESNEAFLARRAYLERVKRAFSETEDERARILPVSGVVPDEQLLRAFQAMKEATGVRIVSVEIVETNP